MNIFFTLLKLVFKQSQRKLIFSITLLVLSVGAFAQTPTFYSGNTNSPSNAFPFSTVAGKQVQSLIAPGEFTGAYFGFITKFYVQGTASITGTWSTFVIKMGQTTATTLPSGALATGLTTVYSATTVTAATTAAGWVSFTLQTPFLYDPTKSLIVDISQCASTGGAINVTNVAKSGFRRTYVNAASCVFTYAGQDANLFNCGVDMQSAGYNDAGVASIDSPTTFCGGVQNIKATIKNYGRNQIQPVTVNWSLNGVVQTPLSYTSMLDTIGKPNNTDQVTLGSYTFPASPPTVVKVWTSNPNGVADTIKVNDTAQVTKSPAISGTFTINPSGSGSSNYTSLTAAVNAMNVGGICGPVYFTVSPGTYNEKVYLNNIVGTSAINTITFDGVDTALCTVTFNQSTAASNIGVFTVLGTSYVTIKNFTIVCSNATYGAGVSIQSGSNNCTVNNCVALVTATSGSTNAYGFGICGTTISTTSTGANNTISNCRVAGGYAGIALYGNSSTSFINGNSVIGCRITGSYLYGIYDYYQNLNIVTDNRISLSSATNTYGMYVYYCQNNKCDRNIVVAAYMGIYIYNNNNAGSSRMSCSNNIINMNGPYAYSTNYGLYSLYCVNGDFFHNTVYTCPTVASGYCAYVGYGSGCAYKNNIFHSTNSGMYAVYCPSVTFTKFDHNIMYATGSNYVYWGGAYSNLATLKAAASAFHQKSLFKTANFVSLVNKAEDLHIITTAAADYGDGNYTTLLDVDSEARCQFAPTIGADECKFGSGSPTANFTAPDSIFLNSPITLLNNNSANDPLGHKWYVDGSFKGTSLDLPYVFTTTGNHTIKIVTEGCFGIDSITVTVVVYMPTQVPIANFIADLNTVETYQNVSLKDLSIKGPTYWNWTFIPSAGVNYTLSTNNNSQNPIVNFANPGLYQVCMWDSNAMGKSTTVCKTAYILVRSTSQMCIFPFDTKVSGGTLYDDGGPNGNYGANHTATAPCNFLIDPCANSVTLSFSTFNLGTGAFLKVYDGSDKFGFPLHTGSGFTGTTLPPNLTASTGKMYIEFITATTLAPGFSATWTSVAGTYAPPAGKLSLPDTLYDCGAATDIAFVPDNSLFERDGAYYRWFLDYGNSNQMSDFEGKGAYMAQWSYGSTGLYIIRCEIEGCGGNLIIMDTIIVDHPTRGPLMDFKADITTATPTDIVTLSDLSKYDPIYRRWKITGPGNPIVINGNQTTKNYSLKFPVTGTYTVSLLDSNCISSDSLKKIGYITVINYCTPVVSLLNSDFAIEKTTFGRTDTIINGIIPGFKFTNSNPAIGTIGYRDNTAQFAAYIIGGTSVTKSVEAVVDLGGTFDYAVTRNGNNNLANFKIWIDYNQDGTFQNSEMVASSGSTAVKTYIGTITIPLTAKIGNTRMRVATAFDNLSNTPCGVNQYGEYNDFRVRVTPDLTKPLINFIGGDTLTVEVGRTFVEPGYTVTDNVTNPTPFTYSGIASGTQITSHPSNFSYTIVATDGAGNIKSRSRVVNSGKDVTKPIITLVGSSPINVEVKSSYTDSGATAIDFYFGNFTPFIVSNSNVNINKVGTYTVTFDLTDSSGNAATTVTRTVNVRDTQKPVITLGSPDTIYVNVFSVFNAPTVTVSDNYYSGLSYTVSGGPVNTNVIGTYVLNYNATDSSGNIASTKKLTVIVQDTKAPTVFLATGDLTIDVNTLTTVPEPGYIIYDNYYATGTLTVVVNYSNVKLNIVGDYSVRYYVSDPAGNVDSSKIRIYHVVDRIAPVITLTGSGFITWTRWKAYVDPGNIVTDNYYTGLVCTADISKVNVYVPGIYEVIFNVTDGSGNIAISKKRLVEVTAEANGISENSANNLISVYPNPTRGVVNIDLNITEASNSNVVIYDANGKVVYNNSSVTPLNHNLQVDLSNEAAGMYFIKVVTNNSSTSKSFTIQK